MGCCRHIVSPNPPWWQLPLLYAGRAFLKSPQQGAATAIHLCTSPEVRCQLPLLHPPYSVRADGWIFHRACNSALVLQVAGISSKYWVDCKPVRSSAASYDTEAASRLWEVSQQLTQAPDFLGTAEVAPQAS